MALRCEPLEFLFQFSCIFPFTRPFPSFMRTFVRVRVYCTVYQRTIYVFEYIWVKSAYDLLSLSCVVIFICVQNECSSCRVRKYRSVNLTSQQQRYHMVRTTIHTAHILPLCRYCHTFVFSVLSSPSSVIFIHTPFVQYHFTEAV